MSISIKLAFTCKSGSVLFQIRLNNCLAIQIKMDHDHDHGSGGNDAPAKMCPMIMTVSAFNLFLICLSN